jgi:hypothetical protein
MCATVPSRRWRYPTPAIAGKFAAAGLVEQVAADQPTHSAALSNELRCRSRCVGAVSAVLLSTALERGGTMTAASG